MKKWTVGLLLLGCLGLLVAMAPIKVEETTLAPVPEGIDMLGEKTPVSEPAVEPIVHYRSIIVPKDQLDLIQKVGFTNATIGTIYVLKYVGARQTKAEDGTELAIFDFDLIELKITKTE